jgi:hypothetical protein
MRKQDMEKILRRRIRNNAVQDILLIIISLCGGVAVLFLTYLLIYAVIIVSLGYLLPVEDYAGYISAGILVLLFIGNQRTSREYLTEYSFSTGTANDKIVSLYIPGAGIGSTVNPLAPDSMHSYVKVITDLLYTGPRIIICGMKKINRLFHLMKLDISGCAEVISVLHNAGGKVSFTEIAERVDGLNPDLSRIFDDLRYTDTVIFLTNDPPGLVLKSEFRTDIR